MTSIIGSYINSTISRVVKFMIELLFKTSKRAQHTSQRWTRRQLQQATSRWQDRWTSEQGKEGELGGALVKLNPHDPNVAVPPVKELSRPAHLIGRPAVICPINPCLRGSVMLGSTSVLFTRSQVCQQSVLPVFFFFLWRELWIFLWTPKCDTDFENVEFSNVRSPARAYGGVFPCYETTVSDTLNPISNWRAYAAS